MKYAQMLIIAGCLVGVPLSVAQAAAVAKWIGAAGETQTAWRPAEAAKGQGVGPFAAPIRFMRVPTADGVMRLHFDLPARRGICRDSGSALKA